MYMQIYKIQNMSKIQAFLVLSILDIRETQYEWCVN